MCCAKKQHRIVWYNHDRYIGAHIQSSVIAYPSQPVFHLSASYAVGCITLVFRSGQVSHCMLWKPSTSHCVKYSWREFEQAEKWAGFKLKHVGLAQSLMWSSLWTIVVVCSVWVSSAGLSPLHLSQLGYQQLMHPSKKHPVLCSDFLMVPQFRCISQLADIITTVLVARTQP